MNYALRFNGADSSVVMGARPEYSSADFTWSVWFRQSVPGPHTVMHIGYEPDSGKLLRLFTDGTTLVAIAGNSAGDGHWRLAGGNASVNVWHHAAVTFGDNGYMRLYLDGAEVAAKPVSSHYNVSGKKLRVGMLQWGTLSESYFGGDIDDVRIYGRELSPQEVGDTYFWGKNITGELVGRWNFDDGTGSVASDSSGTGNNGTINNATWVDAQRLPVYLPLLVGIPVIGGIAYMLLRKK